MRTLMLCLANSRKYGGRCLAGIECFRDETGRLQLRRTENGRPKWIRPVSRSEHGEVPQELARHIHLLDLVEFEQQAPCPSAYQSENVFYTGTFEVAGFLNLKRENLHQLAENQDACVLGSTGKALTAEAIKSLDHSLELVQVAAGNIRFKEWGSQLRLMFPVGEIWYDLPLTDTDFHLKWIENSDILASANDVWLCVSFGLEKDGFHNKLVAGVLWF